MIKYLKPYLNSAVLFGMLSAMPGCDTETSISPRYDRFFIKYYGAQGDQYGADVKATQDGGFILVGTTDPDKSMDGVGEADGQIRQISMHIGCWFTRLDCAGSIRRFLISTGAETETHRRVPRSALDSCRCDP